MRTRRIIVLSICTIALGAFWFYDRAHGERDPGAVGVRAAVEAETGFRSAEVYNTGGRPFTDEAVDELDADLDRLLAQPLDAAAGSQAGLHLWRFTNRLSQGYLTAEQEQRVVAHLDALAEEYPDDAGDIVKTRFMVRNLMLGKEAPNIVGTDFDGEEFELADYRGKVVGLVFSGHWCGPCRGEYPYHRLLLEVMDEADFVLLGVNSDADPKVAKQAKIDERLPYRSWWDGAGEDPTLGPIATLYNVSGWPTIYMLDEDGIIRDRDVREEKIITVAKQMVAAMKRKQAASGQ